MKKNIIISILIIFIIFAGIGFYINISRDNEDIDKNNNEDKLKIFSDYLKDIKLASFDIIGTEYTINDLNHESYSKFIDNSYYLYIKNDNASYDAVNNYIKHIFGKNININKESLLYLDSINDYCYKYDDVNDVYEYNNKCENEKVIFENSNIVNKLYEEDGKYILNVNHYYFKDGNTYCFYDDMIKNVNTVYKYDEDELDNIKNDLVHSRNNRFSCKSKKYTFLYIDNEFLFNSSEVEK